MIQFPEHEFQKFQGGGQKFKMAMLSTYVGLGLSNRKHRVKVLFLEFQKSEEIHKILHVNKTSRSTPTILE